MQKARLVNLPDVGPDNDTERAFVGVCIMNTHVIDQCALAPHHFNNLIWRTLYEAVCALHRDGKPADIFLMLEELKHRGAPDSVILQLSGAIGAVATAANADYYAQIIRERWLDREVACLGEELVAAGCTGSEKLSLVEDRVVQLRQASGNKLPTLEAVIYDELRALQEPIRVGLPSGIGLESVVPGGIPTDRVTTIFGESGSFKSTVKNQIVHAIASAGHVVVDCSFEDSNSLTAARWISRDTGIAYGDIAARQRRVVNPELPSLEAAGRVIAAGDMAPTVEEVVRVARQYKRTANAGAVVVDYIQLLESGKLGQKEVIDEAMRKLQILAKRENLAIIIVSQVKQDQGITSLRRADPRPMPHDMLGSSALRTGTKLAVGVFRPFNFCKAPVQDQGHYGVYARLREVWPDGEEAFDAVYPELLELHIAKQVAGRSPAMVYARVDAPTGVIEPFDVARYLGSV